MYLASCSRTSLGISVGFLRSLTGSISDAFVSSCRYMGAVVARKSSRNVDGVGFTLGAAAATSKEAGGGSI